MRPDETAVPPAVGSLALSPSLQGLFLCRLPYPLLRVSSSCLCPVSLSRLSRPSRPVFSFPCFSVSPCPAPLFRSLRVSLISPLPASLSAFYLLRLLPYSIFFLSSSLCAPLCSLPFFIPASSPHLTSPLLSSSLLLFSSLLFSPASPFAPLLPLGDAGRNRIRKIPDFIAGRFLRSVFRLRCKCSKFSVIMIS